MRRQWASARILNHGHIEGMDWVAMRQFGSHCASIDWHQFLSGYTLQLHWWCELAISLKKKEEGTQPSGTGEDKPKTSYLFS